MNLKKIKPLLAPGSVWDIASRLLSVSFIVGFCLAGVYALTSPVIQKREEQARQTAMSTFFPHCKFTQINTDAPEIERLYMAQQASQPMGYCVLLSVNGYGGAMELMVATDVNNSIVGVEVLSHSETQNIGSVATQSDFLSRFHGKTQGVELVLPPTPATDSQVQGISGATRSSKAVMLAVTTALDAVASLETLPVQSTEPVDEAESAAVKAWFPDAIARPISLPADPASVVEMWEMRTATEAVGYLVKAKTVGLNEAFKITTLVGYDLSGTVISYEILESYELESITSALLRDEFRNQFTGRNTPIPTDGSEGSISMIANMEKSCRAIVQAVNDGMLAVAAVKGGN